MRRISKIMAAKPFHHAAREEKTLGVFPAHADTRAVAAELGNAFGNIAERGESVLERAGKASFRRTPVVDGDDDGAGLDREQARLPVMGFEIAGNPTAAMEKHHRRRFFA